MSILTSRKFRLGLSIFATLLLILAVSGFALTRGYLWHFVLDDQTISRDAFYQLSETSEQTHFTAYCTSNWTVGWFYILEDRCYTDPSALNEYMHMSD